MTIFLQISINYTIYEIYLRGLLKPSYANLCTLQWMIKCHVTTHWYLEGLTKCNEIMTIAFIQDEWLQPILAGGQTLRQGPCRRTPHHTHLWLNPPGCVLDKLFSGSREGEQEDKESNIGRVKCSAVKMQLGLTGKLGKVREKIKRQK